MDFPESLYDYILEKCDTIKVSDTQQVTNEDKNKEKPKETINNNNNINTQGDNNFKPIDMNANTAYDMSNNINALINKKSK